ncbi:MAG: VPLPA-CTERM sorting domain-containing protein [Pseudomonadota bacterium]
MITNALKTLSAAAGIALVGSIASAATVASVSADGDYSLTSYADGAGGEVSAIELGGDYTAFADLGFDTSANNDFLFELDLTVDGASTIDEELFVPGISGDAILGFALGILSDIDLALPGLIDAVVAEVTDGDLLQTEIVPDLFFAFDFTLAPTGPFSGEGTFTALFSEVSIDALDFAGVEFAGEFSGSATISTVPAVPLPASLPLILFGVAGLVAVGRRRDRA